MNVGAICRREVIVIGATADLISAAHRMREHHVGDLVVVDSEESPRVPVGVLTDRDLVVEVLAQELDRPQDLRVSDLLMGDLVTIDEDASVHLAIARMRAEGVRRLPVVDAGGFLVGILTMDDLLGVLANELSILAELARYQPYRESLFRGEPVGRS